MWDLVGNPEDRFSHNEAHLIVDKLASDASFSYAMLLILLLKLYIYSSYYQVLRKP